METNFYYLFCHFTCDSCNGKCLYRTVYICSIHGQSQLSRFPSQALWQSPGKCISDSKGLSTAEEGRGHVTVHMYSVTVKVQTLEAHILKIVCKDSDLYDVRDNLRSGQHVRRHTSRFVVCTKYRHSLNLMGTEMHALSRLWRSIHP